MVDITVSPSFYELALDNYYFLFGIMIIFLYQMYRLSEIKKFWFNLKFIIGFILIFILISMFGEQKLTLMDYSYVILFLMVILPPILIIIEKKSLELLLPQININSIILFGFILAFMLNNNSLTYIMLTLIFITMILFSGKYPNWIENLLYPVYIFIYIICFIILNLNLGTILMNGINPYLNLNFTFFILGVILGYIYFNCVAYIFFLIHYLPGKREHNYFSRLKELFSVINNKFENKINNKYSIIFLGIFLISFLFNIKYNFFNLEYLLFFSILTEKYLVSFTSEEFI